MDSLYTALAALLLPAALLLARRARAGAAASRRAALVDRTVLITGCDSGFGFSLASHCAELGMKVVAACYSDSSEGAQQLRGRGRGVTVVQLDLTQPASLETAVAAARSVAGEAGLHCLVNNAATMVFGETSWQTEAMIRNQMEVNFLGPVLLSRACLPLLVAARGRIVNMVSNCTEVPLPTLGPYTASKVTQVTSPPPADPHLCRPRCSPCRT